MGNPFRYFNSSPEVILLVVMMYVRWLCHVWTTPFAGIPISSSTIDELGVPQLLNRREQTL